MDGMQFYSQLAACSAQYDQDNQWFGFHRGGPVWSQGTWVQFILAAWKLYKNARISPMILLGDTKIRSDPHLLFNFGLVSNSDSPQEVKDKQMVEGMMAKRRGVAASANTGRVGPVVKVMGSGSILSAQRWSPMLNDALMLGAITSRQDFHFALNDDEQAVWAREIEPLMPRGDVRSTGAADFASRRAAFGAAVTTKSREQQLWLTFIKRVPRILWENGNPRVFVRELLGLKFFGYKPVFTRHELGFIHVGNATDANFQNYLTGLRAVGLHSRDRSAIMASLGEFLFQDKKALETVGL